MNEQQKQYYSIFIIIILVASLIFAIVKVTIGSKDTDSNDTNTNIKQENTIKNNVLNNTISTPANKTQTDEEDEKIAKERYEKAYNLYWDNGFTLANRTTKIEVNGKQENATAIEHYDETVNAVFSNNGRIAFEKNKVNLVNQNGIYYLLTNTKQKDTTHTETSYKKVEETENSKTYLVTEKYGERTQKNTLTLVKENETWKVEDFTLPD